MNKSQADHLLEEVSKLRTRSYRSALNSEVTQDDVDRVHNKIIAMVRNLEEQR